MKDFNNFKNGMDNLKVAYPTWQVNTNDPATIAVWFDWFFLNTKLSDAGFTEMVNEYKRTRVYPPLSPRDLFDVEIELIKNEHINASKIWSEAISAFGKFEKQDSAYLRWVKVECGNDAYAMEFLMSKELLRLMQEWIQDTNSFNEPMYAKKASQAWNDFIARKLSKAPKQIANRIGFEADDVLKKLE